MLAQAAPLPFAEFGAAPVVVARLVLTTERHAPWLARGALGGGDVRLELHGVGARLGDRVDIGVREAQASVVRERHFPDDASRAASEHARADPHLALRQAPGPLPSRRRTHRPPSGRLPPPVTS